MRDSDAFQHANTHALLVKLAEDGGRISFAQFGAFFVVIAVDLFVCFLSERSF